MKADRRFGFVAVTFGAGVLTAGQARINSSLAIELGNPLQAAWTSFVTGLALLCVAAVFRRSMRAGLSRVWRALRTRDLPRWQVVGGLIGAFFVGVQSSVVGVLGVALFTVAVVAGQTSNSLVVDKFGWGPAGRNPITLRRVAAAGLAMAAVLLAVSDRIGSASFAVGALAISVIAGALTAVQQAINGRVAGVAGGAMAATWLNFLLGTGALSAALAVQRVVGGWALNWTPQAWWSYTGGLIGIAFIASSAWVVGHIGVLLLTLGQISGGLVGALAIDVVAPISGANVTAITVLGVVLTIVAVSIAVGPRRRVQAPADVESTG